MIDYHTIPKSKLYVVIHWFTCRAMMFGLRTIGHPIFPYKERHKKVFHNIYKTNYTFFLFGFLPFLQAFNMPQVLQHVSIAPHFIPYPFP
jgi:hypothetical protein